MGLPLRYWWCVCQLCSHYLPHTSLSPGYRCHYTTMETTSTQITISYNMHSLQCLQCDHHSCKFHRIIFITVSLINAVTCSSNPTRCSTACTRRINRDLHRNGQMITATPRQCGRQWRVGHYHSHWVHRSSITVRRNCSTFL